jgi:hypothetical protein
MRVMRMAAIQVHHKLRHTNNSTGTKDRVGHDAISSRLSLRQIGFWNDFGELPAFSLKRLLSVYRLRVPFVWRATFTIGSSGLLFAGKVSSPVASLSSAADCPAENERPALERA